LQQTRERRHPTAIQCQATSWNLMNYQKRLPFQKITAQSKMSDKKNIFAIVGSASSNSSNEKLIAYFSKFMEDVFNVHVFKDLKTLPHFDPSLSVSNTPQSVLEFRAFIENANGILICTPEYVFSIPSGLKNAIEWCIATTVFSDKPTGIITASANGEKGHEELQLIMKTIMADFEPATTLLIQGIKGKINEQGEIHDDKTREDMSKFADSFKELFKKDNC
jgi:chromate reductase